MPPSGDAAFSFVQPGADYTKISPIDSKRSVTLINEYIINTATFLSQLMISTDKKLMCLQDRLCKLRLLISILEAKLNSIGSLNMPSNRTISSNLEESPRAPAQEATVSNGGSGTGNTEDAIQEPETVEEEIPDIPLLPIEYLPFLKQLKVGVHPMQVRMNIQTAGLDAALIMDDEGVSVVNIREAITSLEAAT